MPIQAWSEHIWVVTLTDEPALSEELVNAADLVRKADSPPEVVFDLSAVTRMSSVDFSQLLNLRRLAVQRGTRIKITGLSDGVWGIFLATGLDKIFDFAQDVPSALAALQLNR